jgi:hypothetical protein
MSVVISELQIDAEEKTATDARRGAPAAAPRAPSSPAATAAPPPPVRIQIQHALRHHCERLARVRSS